MNHLLPFEWVLATRFLREGILQTLFIIAGVALGVSVIVFMSALLTGVQDNFFKTLLALEAQIVIKSPEEAPRSLRQAPGTEYAAVVQPRAQRERSLDQWEKVRDTTLSIPGVLVVTPVVEGSAFITRGDANIGVAVRGIEPESYLRLIALREKIIAGSPDLNSTDALIGSDLAKDLGLTIGDKLTLKVDLGMPVVLFVSGIFDLGNEGLNSKAVYVSLRTAQSLLSYPGGVTRLWVNLAAPYEAKTIAQQIATQPGVKVENWIETNADFFKALEGNNLSFGIIRVFIGLTSALGIASVLIVSVVQKSKEIGILRATGTTRGQILGVFLLQGAILGLLGSLLGSFMGWGFLIGWRAIAVDDEGVPYYTLEAGVMLYVYVAIGATAVGTLSALFPAQRAARLDPAVAIRG
jgi:lipoprotein-releasing system permease protein